MPPQISPRRGSPICWMLALAVLLLPTKIALSQRSLGLYAHYSEETNLSFSVEAIYFDEYPVVASGEARTIPESGEAFRYPGPYLSFRYTVVGRSDDGSSTRTLWQWSNYHSVESFSSMPPPYGDWVFLVHDVMLVNNRLLMLGQTGGSLYVWDVDVDEVSGRHGSPCKFPHFELATFASQSKLSGAWLLNEDGVTYILMETESGGRDSGEEDSQVVLSLPDGQKEAVQMAPDTAPVALRARVGKGRAFSQMPPYGEIVDRAIQEARRLREAEGDKE